MPVLIGILLAILTIGVILYPFLKARFRPQTNRTLGPPDQRARGDREAIYEDIRTLQLEYELGGVEERDYHERLRASRLQAAAALHAQEQKELELDRMLEEEILLLRVLRQDGNGPPRCSSCGSPWSHVTSVCPKCGAQPVRNLRGHSKGEGNEEPPS